MNEKSKEIRVKKIIGKIENKAPPSPPDYICIVEMQKDRKAPYFYENMFLGF